MKNSWDKELRIHKNGLILKPALVNTRNNYSSIVEAYRQLLSVLSSAGSAATYQRLLGLKKVVIPERSLVLPWINISAVRALDTYVGISLIAVMGSLALYK